MNDCWQGLKCPDCDCELVASDVSLRCRNDHVFPIVAGVPRFVCNDSYAKSFGEEWHLFPRVQLDSYTGTQISYQRFKQITGLEARTFANKKVLDVGCGTGRFMEVMAQADVDEVWGVDLSSAVDIASRNLAKYHNCYVIQADLSMLPFREESFDFIYSFGVLHHTPSAELAFYKLLPYLRPGGIIAIWVYGRGGTSGIYSSWLPRPHQVYGPIIRLLPEHIRHKTLRLYTKVALWTGELPMVGRLFQLLLPVQDLRLKKPFQDGYEQNGDSSRREKIRFEWALHSAYDRYTPTYTARFDHYEVVEWAKKANLVDISKSDVPAAIVARKPEVKST